MRAFLKRQIFIFGKFPLPFGRVPGENIGMKIGNVIGTAACMLAGICGMTFLSACDGDDAGTIHADAQTHFPLRFSDGSVVCARLALTEIERLRGLMGCRGLASDEGMLFVYSIAEARGFWMKNVPIDLDIGFFDPSGKLLEVYTMKANDPEIVYSKSEDIMYCLEMRSAWFQENGVLPENGVSLNLRDVQAAVRARGFRTR